MVSYYKVKVVQMVYSVLYLYYLKYVVSKKEQKETTLRYY